MAEWNVEVTAEDDDLPRSLLSALEHAARAVLHAENGGDCDLSVALVADEEITRLNREYLAHDYPTDVIAFRLEQPGATPVGDVYIGLDQARRQAAELGIDPREELLRLVVHGTLHFLGWDHPADGERSNSPMYERQEQLVNELMVDS